MIIPDYVEGYEDSVYFKEGVEEMMESDAISCEEEGFMQGYVEA